ncbi:hypothetical protein KCM76_20815 [Zooshikella marina]|uniref:hypothetical protein n=1 Tax=Zooshikella ganghwensis TaxID=202772 RepID=UPI001BB08F3B|nr:hypothetical protein [Zooshikella ganghwensis]MBU2708448.1 hypothetical protein [Zooshikella ganghwensis]
MREIIATLIAILCISNVHAERETTNVFCATPDGSHWDWLDVNGTPLEVNGEWGRGIATNSSEFDYFKVSEEIYLFINQMCKQKFSSEYVAQPSDNYWGEWYIFLVQRSNGSQYVTEGKYNTTSRDLLPSEFRL